MVRACLTFSLCKHSFNITPLCFAVEYDYIPLFKLYVKEKVTPCLLSRIFAGEMNVCCLREASNATLSSVLLAVCAQTVAAAA
jgi:hypothetical protein